MLEIFFIRHGKTYGNTLGRYIGTTDEPLCREGRERLAAGTYPKVDAVYASPMKRCLETAAILYPGLTPRVIDQLRECDFGEFENKNYLELSSNPAYQEWVDSGGALPFPGGESQEAFKKRCQEGFLKVLELELLHEKGKVSPKGTEECIQDTHGLQASLRDELSTGVFREQETVLQETLHRIALVVHGGTIMSILEAYGSPRESFYHWQAKNGEGFRALLDLPCRGSGTSFEKVSLKRLPKACSDGVSPKAYEMREEVRLYEIHAVCPFAGISA